MTPKTIKTVAELRRLKIGDTLTLVYSNFSHKSLGISRRIIKMKTNGLYLETEGKPSGSWLAFPAAKDFAPELGGFAVCDDKAGKVLRYTVTIS